MSQGTTQPGTGDAALLPLSHEGFWICNDKNTVHVLETPVTFFFFMGLTQQAFVIVLFLMLSFWSVLHFVLFRCSLFF